MGLQLELHRVGLAGRKAERLELASAAVAEFCPHGIAGISQQAVEKMLGCDLSIATLSGGSGGELQCPLGQ